MPSSIHSHIHNHVIQSWQKYNNIFLSKKKQNKAIFMRILTFFVFDCATKTWISCYYWSLGFSRWGLWIHACACVRPSMRACVRHTISRKPRIRFLWFFAQSCILMKLKKSSKRIFENILVFKILAKNGQFLLFLAIFSQKNQVFGLFLRIRTSDLSKTWSETWDNCFDSSNGSVVSRKILVLAALAIFG